MPHIIKKIFHKRFEFYGIFFTILQNSNKCYIKSMEFFCNLKINKRRKGVLCLKERTEEMKHLISI